MYTIQALWTAARHDIGAKFVVCNNRSYQLLKLNVQQYWRERGIAEHDFPGSFDLGDPAIHFDELARRMGVPATRVETADEVGPAIAEALAHDGPFLIDLIVHQEVPGHDEDAANRRPSPARGRTRDAFSNRTTGGRRGRRAHRKKRSTTWPTAGTRRSTSTRRSRSCYAMMPDDGNEMEWPEVPTHGHAEFRIWYERVIAQLLRRGAHDQSVESTIDGDRADVKVVVNWKASVWKPPAPKSTWLHMDAFQTWEVVRDTASGKALINKYFVDSFAELPDSDGGLGVDPRDVLLAYYRTANAGDWQEWLTLFAEDVVIDEQLAGHVEGLDILRGAIGGMEKGYSRFANVPKHFVVQGNNAAVVSHISAANAAGESIEAEVTNYFQFRDGKIAYMANFHDTRPFDRLRQPEAGLSDGRLRLHRGRHRLGRLRASPPGSPRSPTSPCSRSRPAAADIPRTSRTPPSGTRSSAARSTGAT